MDSLLPVHRAVWENHAGPRVAGRFTKAQPVRPAFVFPAACPSGFRTSPSDLWAVLCLTIQRASDTNWPEPCLRCPSRVEKGSRCEADAVPPL